VMNKRLTACREHRFVLPITERKKENNNTTWDYNNHQSPWQLPQIHTQAHTAQ
jgi:hypothetical protein